jgi:hypothetical protein
MDAHSLARALAGEGRRHVMVGSAKWVRSKEHRNQHATYYLIGNSDGLNVLPDFALVGVASGGNATNSDVDAGLRVLASYLGRLIQETVLDLISIEGRQESSPLQHSILEAFVTAKNAATTSASPGELSMTAGLMFAEIIILGHQGHSCAFLVDRHHIEQITPFTPEGLENGEMDGGDSAKPGLNEDPPSARDEDGSVSLFSRPVPRGGYIVLCTEGLCSCVTSTEIQRILLQERTPQEGSEALILAAQMKGADSAAAIVMYFPPDFGPWR